MSPQLFWDVDPETVDTRKNARWLLERVMQRGTWEDWLLVKERYGKDELQALAPALRLDAKSANFLKIHCQQ
jgi:hypothetical protein